MKQSERNYQRIVVKIGASLLGDPRIVNQLVSQIVSLINNKIPHLTTGRKREVILVSSGAVACGMAALGLKTRPTKLGHLQAAASLGQNKLMELYREKFSVYNIKCAQILLTWEDFNERSRYLNAKNTLQVLLKWGSLPIVNENDTVSVDEIRFGDNDRLSALVANLIDADMMIMLSDVEGLLNPKTNQVIRVVEKVTAGIEKMASSSTKATSVGGMKTKLSAARIAMESQIPCLIVDGKKPNALELALCDPFNAGTLFLPAGARITARKKWLSFCARTKGKICVDEGAKNALFAGKSLLVVGVVGLTGNFNPGDIVEIADKKGLTFARGKVNFSAHDLDRIKGKQKMNEAVHRDDLVVRSSFHDLEKSAP
ncbi:MAG: glutamate 5-kinase [Candidatus Omnitrophota bacterium]